MVYPKLSEFLTKLIIELGIPLLLRISTLWKFELFEIKNVNVIKDIIKKEVILLKKEILFSLIFIRKLSAPKDAIVRIGGNMKRECLVVVKVNLRSITKVKNKTKKLRQEIKTLNLFSVTSFFKLSLNLILIDLESNLKDFINLPVKELIPIKKRK